MAKYEYWITEEGLLLIGGWAKDGLTEVQIAENIGISRSTLFEWKKRFPNLSDTLKSNKEIVDRMVENALLKAALGYEFEEDGMTKDGDVVPLRKMQHPNTTALIFWLKNRKPEKWRDKQETEVSGNVSVTFVDDIGEEDET